MTSALVILIAVAALLAVVLQFVRRANLGKAQEPGRYPFESCLPLTQREQKFYWLLRKMFPDRIVLSQVGLARILRVEKGHDFRGWLERINTSSVDFLICHPDATIVAAIELDEAVRDTLQAERDAKKARALESAGIRLLRFRDIPSEDELRRAFAD
jgi:Protein of unknown function (DUF2726)